MEFKNSIEIKHFLWRASSDILPTKEQLRTRRVEVNALCPVCNLTCENVFHVLVECEFARLCWTKAGYGNIQQGFSNFAEWPEDAFQRFAVNEVHIISMITWALWKNRNEIVWKQKSKEPTNLVESAILVLNKWQGAQDRSFDLSFGFMTQSDGAEHWKQPNENTVKVNTDAALFEDSG